MRMPRSHQSREGLPRSSTQISLKRKPTNSLSTGNRSSRCVTPCSLPLAKQECHLTAGSGNQTLGGTSFRGALWEEPRVCRCEIRRSPLWRLLAKWPSVHFLWSCLDRERISREQMPIVGQIWNLYEMGQNKHRNRAWRRKLQKLRWSETPGWYGRQEERKIPKWASSWIENSSPSF